MLRSLCRLPSAARGLQRVNKSSMAMPVLEDEIKPMIVPEYWRNGQSAMPDSHFKIDCSDYNLSSGNIPNELKERMEETFDRVGLVYLVNTGLEKFPQMSPVARVVAKNLMEYEGGSNWRDGIVENVYETGAPKEAHLHYHHEMAYIGNSTKMLAFCCEHALPDGRGWSFMSDQVGLTKALMKTEFGQKLKERGICYVRCMTDRDAYAGKDDERKVYNHWQISLASSTNPVETVEAAEIAAAKQGLKVTWKEDPIGDYGRYMETRFYVSAFEYCPYTDRNLLYASQADDAMWFDTWPGVMELPNHQRPLKITYGDDSEVTYEEFKEWVDLYDDFGVAIPWSRGDIAICCNYRWAHGRPAYHLEEGEKRELGVILGEMYRRQGDLPGKWYS